MRAVLDELMHRELMADVARFAAAMTPDETGPWASALPYSRGSIQLTTGELREFFEAYIALVARYQRPAEDTPPGARTVQTRFFAYPEPETDDS